IVQPGLYAISVVSKLGHTKASLPAVIAYGNHDTFCPARFTCPAIAQHSAQQVMAIGKDIRFNYHLLTYGAVNGKSAGDLGWLDPLNNHSSPPRFRIHTASFPPHLLSKRHAKSYRPPDHQRLSGAWRMPCTSAIAARAALADTGRCCAQKPARRAFVHKTFKRP